MAALEIFEKHHVVARLQRRKQVLRQQAAVLRVRVKREIHAGEYLALLDGALVGSYTNIDTLLDELSWSVDELSPLSSRCTTART